MRHCGIEAMDISKQMYVLFGIFTLVGILAIAPSAFADTAQVTITKGAGASANADCITAKNCFDPNPITVAPGTEVEWMNTDTVAHTVTSGQPTDNETGTVFDSGMIKPGNEFKFTLQNEGTYNYFCMVHPWMTGQVIVSASATQAGLGQQGGIPLGSNYTAPAGSSTPQPAQPAPPSQAPQYGSQVQNTTLAGLGQQGGIPLGSNYTAPASPSTPVPSTSGGGMQYTDADNPTGPASLSGWAIGLVVAGVLSGIGVWAAVRRR